MATVSLAPFNSEAWAQQYAERFYNTDRGIREIYYFPAEADQREVRLVIVNDAIAEREANLTETTYVTNDREGPEEHRVYFLDVTPTQWIRIASQEVPLPPGWSLMSRKLMPRS